MRRLPAFLPGAAIIIATLLVAGSPPQSASAGQGTSFNPTLQASVSDSSPGAIAGTVYDFYIAAPDANFADVVSFLPPDFEIARDSDVPNGAIAGELFANVTLGLLNTTCNIPLPAEITLLEATTNISDLALYPYDAGYYDQDGDGLPEWGQHYPFFLMELFPGVQPVQRLYGQVFLAGVWNMVNFLVFEPGQSLPFFPAFDESLGYPTLALLNNPYGQILVSPISDFCTPFTNATTVYGETLDNPATPANEAGFVLRTNPPSDGAYTATSYVRSLWNSDGDALENNIDPCPYTTDNAWDPRTANSPGDADNDGLPAACDPNDNQTNSDQDGDGYPNRLDLCPFQDDYGFDADADDVGDACDRAPYDPSDGGLNHRHTVCTRSVIVIGSGGDPGQEPPCPEGPAQPVIRFYEPQAKAGIGNQVSFDVSASASPYGFGGAAGVTIEYLITGANPGSGSCMTDGEGRCSFSYTGANLGVDTVTVSAPDFAWSESAQVTWQEPPPHDLLANAVPIDAIPYEHTGDTYLSGREPGEVTCESSGGTGSVWYRLTPAEDTMIRLTVDSQVYPFVGVYTGQSVNALDSVYCSNSYGADSASTAGFGGAPSQLHHFEAEAGVTYYISIETYDFFGPGNTEVTLHVDVVSGISVGDMNCDSAVGVIDALIVLRYDSGLPVPECSSAWGDVNCDGFISPVDALILLFFDAKVEGFPTHWPGCLPIGWSG